MSFVKGAKDGKHYWLTPPDVFKKLDNEFHFNFDPAPYPKPKDFDGLTCEWGTSNYVNPPFGGYIGDDGKKYGPTKWARKAIEENKKGKTIIFIYPLNRWILEMLQLGVEVRNLKTVKWLATEDGSEMDKGIGQDIACFILRGKV